MHSEEEVIFRERTRTRLQHFQRIDSNFLRLQRMFTHLQKFSTQFECSIKMISCLMGNFSNGSGSDTDSESEILTRLREGGHLEWDDQKMCGKCRTGGHCVDMETEIRVDEQRRRRVSGDNGESAVYGGVGGKGRRGRREKRGRAKSQIDVTGSRWKDHEAESKRGALSQSSKARKRSRGLTGHGGGCDEVGAYHGTYRTKHRVTQKNNENFEIYRSRHSDRPRYAKDIYNSKKKQKKHQFNSNFTDSDGNIYLPRSITQYKMRNSAINEREPSFQVKKQKTWHTSHKHISTKSRHIEHTQIKTISEAGKKKKIRNKPPNRKHDRGDGDGDSDNQSKLRSECSPEDQMKHAKQGVIQFKEIGGKRILTLCNSKKESPKTERILNWQNQKQNFIIGGRGETTKRGCIGADGGDRITSTESWILEKDLGSSSQNVFESQEMMRYRNQSGSEGGDRQVSGEDEEEDGESQELMTRGTGGNETFANSQKEHTEIFGNQQNADSMRQSSRHKNDLYNTDEDSGDDDQRIDRPDFIERQRKFSHEPKISFGKQVFPGKDAFKKTKTKENPNKNTKKQKKFWVGFEDLKDSCKYEKIDLKQGIRAGNNSLERGNDFSKYFPKNQVPKIIRPNKEDKEQMRSFWSRENFGFEQKSSKKFSKHSLKEKRMKKLKGNSQGFRKPYQKLKNGQTANLFSGFSRNRSLTPNPKKVFSNDYDRKKKDHSMTPNPKTARWPTRPHRVKNHSPLKAKLKRSQKNNPKFKAGQNKPNKTTSNKLTKVIHKKNNEDQSFESDVILNLSQPLPNSEVIYDVSQEQKIKIKLRKEECEKGIRRLSAIEHPHNKLRNLILLGQKANTSCKRRKSSKSLGEIRRILDNTLTKPSHRVIDFSTPDSKPADTQGFLKYISKNGEDELHGRSSLEGGIDTWGRPSDTNHPNLKEALREATREINGGAVDMKGGFDQGTGNPGIQRNQNSIFENQNMEPQDLKLKSKNVDLELLQIMNSESETPNISSSKLHKKNQRENLIFQKFGQKFHLPQHNTDLNKNSMEITIHLDPSQPNFKTERELNKGDTLEFVNGDFETEEIESNLMDDTEIGISSKRTSFFGANFLGDTSEPKRNSFANNLVGSDERKIRKNSFSMKENNESKETPEEKGPDCMNEHKKEKLNENKNLGDRAALKAVKRPSLELMKIKESLKGDARNITEKMKILWPSGEVVFKNLAQNQLNQFKEFGERKQIFSKTEAVKDQQIDGSGHKGSDSSNGRGRGHEKRKSQKIRRISRLSKSYHEGFQLHSSERNIMEGTPDWRNGRNKRNVFKKDVFEFLNKSVDHESGQMKPDSENKRSLSGDQIKKGHYSVDFHQSTSRKISIFSSNSQQDSNPQKTPKLADRNFQVGKLHVRGSSWSGSEGEANQQTFGARGKKFDFVNETDNKNENMGQPSKHAEVIRCSVGDKNTPKQTDMEVIEEESEDREGRDRPSLQKDKISNLFGDKFEETDHKIGNMESAVMNVLLKKNPNNGQIFLEIKENFVETYNQGRNRHSGLKKKFSIEQIMDENLVKRGTYESEILESDGFKFPSAHSKERHQEPPAKAQTITSRSNTLRIKTGTTENDEITFESSSYTARRNTHDPHSERNILPLEMIGHSFLKSNTLEEPISRNTNTRLKSANLEKPHEKRTFDSHLLPKKNLSENSQIFGTDSHVSALIRPNLEKIFQIGDSQSFLHPMNSKEIDEHEFQDNLKSLISDQNIRSFKTRKKEHQTKRQSHFGRPSLNELQNSKEKNKNQENFEENNQNYKSEFIDIEIDEDSNKGELRVSQSDQSPEPTDKISKQRLSLAKSESHTSSEAHFVSDFKEGYLPPHLESPDTVPIRVSFTKHKKSGAKKTFKRLSQSKQKFKRNSKSGVTSERLNPKPWENVPQIKSSRLHRTKGNFRYAVAGLSGESDQKKADIRESACRRKLKKTKRAKKPTQSDEDTKLVQMILDNNEKMNQTVLQQVLEQGQRSATMLRDCFKDVLNQNQQMGIIWQEKEAKIQSLEKELEFLKQELHPKNNQTGRGRVNENQPLIRLNGGNLKSGQSQDNLENYPNFQTSGVTSDPVYEFPKSLQPHLISDNLNESEQQAPSQSYQNENETGVSVAHNSQDVNHIHMSRTTIQKYENDQDKTPRAHSCDFIPNSHSNEDSLFNTLPKDGRFQKKVCSPDDSGEKKSTMNDQITEGKHSVFTNHLDNSMPQTIPKNLVSQLERENQELKSRLREKERALEEMQSRIEKMDETKTQKANEDQGSPVGLKEEVKSVSIQSPFFKMTSQDQDEPESQLYRKGKRLRRSKRSLDLKNSAEKEETLNFQTFDQKAKGNETLFADIVVENDESIPTHEKSGKQLDSQFPSHKNVFLNSESIAESLRIDLVVARTGSFVLKTKKHVRHNFTQTDEKFSKFANEGMGRRSQKPNTQDMGECGKNTISGNSGEEHDHTALNMIGETAEHDLTQRTTQQSSMNIGIQTNDVLKFLLCQAMCIDSGLDAYEESEDNSQETLRNSHPNNNIPKPLSSDSENLLDALSQDEYADYQDLKIKVHHPSSEEDEDDLSMSHQRTKLSQISEITERSETSPTSESNIVNSQNLGKPSSNRNFSSYSNEPYQPVIEKGFNARQVFTSVLSDLTESDFIKKMEEGLNKNDKNQNPDFTKFKSHDNQNFKEEFRVEMEGKLESGEGGGENEDDILIDSYEDSETEKEGADFMNSNLFTEVEKPIRDLVLNSIAQLSKKNKIHENMEIETESGVQNDENEVRSNGLLVNQTNSENEDSNTENHSEKTNLQAQIKSSNDKALTQTSNFEIFNSQTNPSLKTQTVDSPSHWNRIPSSKNDEYSVETILTKESKLIKTQKEPLDSNKTDPLDEFERYKKVNSSCSLPPNKIKGEIGDSSLVGDIKSDQKIETLNIEIIKENKNIGLEEGSENEEQEDEKQAKENEEWVQQNSKNSDANLESDGSGSDIGIERSNGSGKEMLSHQSSKKKAAKVYLQNLVTNLENSDEEIKIEENGMSESDVPSKTTKTQIHIKITSDLSCEKNDGKNGNYKINKKQKNERFMENKEHSIGSNSENNSDAETNNEKLNKNSKNKTKISVKKWGQFLTAMNVPKDLEEEIEFLGTQSFQKDDENSQMSSHHRKKSDRLHISGKSQNNEDLKEEEGLEMDKIEKILLNFDSQRKISKTNSQQRESIEGTELGTYETERRTISEWSRQVVKEGDLNFENMYLRQPESEISHPESKSKQTRTENGSNYGKSDGRKVKSEISKEEPSLSSQNKDNLGSKSKIQGNDQDPKNHVNKNSNKQKSKPKKSKKADNNFSPSPSNKNFDRKFSLQTKSRYIFGVDKMNHLRESDPIFKRSPSQPETTYLRLNKEKLKTEGNNANNASQVPLRSSQHSTRRSGRSNKSQKSQKNCEASYRSNKSNQSSKSNNRNKGERKNSNKKTASNVISSYSKIFKQRIKRIASQEWQNPKKRLEKKLTQKMNKDLLKSKEKEKETGKQKQSSKIQKKAGKRRGKDLNQKSAENLKKKSEPPKRVKLAQTDDMNSELLESSPQISVEYNPSQFHYPKHTLSKKKESQSNLTISIHRKNSFPETMGKVPSPVNSETSGENIYRNRSLRRLENQARGRLQTNETGESIGEDLNIYKKQTKQSALRIECQDWEMIESVYSEPGKLNAVALERKLTVYDYQNEPTPKNFGDKVLTLLPSSDQQESCQTIIGISRQQGPSTEMIPSESRQTNLSNQTNQSNLLDLVESEEGELPVDSEEALREQDLSKRTLKKSETKKNWRESRNSKVKNFDKDGKQKFGKNSQFDMRGEQDLMGSESRGQFKTFDFGDRRPLRSTNWDKKSSTMEKELEREDF